ncbi:hypothetical protein GIJ60_14670 [Klebsiella quasipneumoniae]|uniref:hypothetical protein n=1 Tax=Klebsiella quasipneumoniae TaxID=1463165 RepID=UPI0012995EA7|nr:hypothetical protein [Klebsiella quasipneumoniae]MRE40052.1 hypothetical protein [Klebsiella quasipneumoniae]MRF89282.1 hypothetical protein [Klebsiella quasipneumoniae]
MAEIKEIIDSLKDWVVTPIQESISFRARSAFFGSFIISWLVLNWDKIAYFILSGDDIIKKLYILKSELPEVGYEYSYFHLLVYHFWYPLLFATLFTALYPASMILIKWFHGFFFRKLNSLDVSYQKNIEAQKKELEDDIIEKKGEQDKRRAVIDREIAKNRQEAYIFDNGTDALRQEFNNNTLNNERLVIEINTNKEIIKKLEDRKVEINDEIIDLAGRYDTLKTQDEIHKNLTSEIAKLTADLDVAISSKKEIDNRLVLIVSSYKSYVSYSSLLREALFNERLNKDKLYDEVCDLIDKINDGRSLINEYPMLSTVYSQRNGEMPAGDYDQIEEPKNLFE